MMVLTFQRVDDSEPSVRGGVQLLPHHLLKHGDVNALVSTPAVAYQLAEGVNGSGGVPSPSHAGKGRQTGVIPTWDSGSYSRDSSGYSSGSHRVSKRRKADST